MAKKFLGLGILVMVLVFGMTVVGCDNGSTGGDGGSRNSEPKIISITGFNDTVSWVELYVYIKPDADGLVALNIKSPYDQNITLALLDKNNGIPFTGNGSYIIIMHICYQGDNDCYDYAYTNGKTLAQLGITESSTYAEIDSKAPRYNISSTVSVIAFNQFLLLPKGFMDRF